MQGEVHDVAQEGMIIKFQPLHAGLASNLGYHCPFMHEKCHGTCTFDVNRSLNCFNWDSARIFLHELKINGQRQDFSSLNTMRSNGWNFYCRSMQSTCTPPVTLQPFDHLRMVRQDGADFYYTYTFTGIEGSSSESPTRMPTAFPSASPTKQPSMSPTLNPTRMPSERPTFNPSEMPSESPTFNPTGMPSKNPTFNPTANPSKPPTAADFIIKVKAFHGNPEDIVDHNKVDDQPDVDIDLYGFNKKITPI